MRQDLIVSQSVDVKAEPEQVWNALTNPEIIKEYLFGTETITDWKVGSEIIFQGEYEGHKYRDHGIIEQMFMILDTPNHVIADLISILCPMEYFHGLSIS